MYFIPFDSCRVVFGWSAKAACTHVKNLYWFLRGRERTHPDPETRHKQIHHLTYREWHPSWTANGYKLVVFIRNPYKRLVSGFQYHYGLMGRTFNRRKPMTLETILTELDAHGHATGVNKHHFTPQLSEAWVPTLKPDVVFDIESIDYGALERLTGQPIPARIRDFRGHHTFKVARHATPDDGVAHNKTFRQLGGVKYPLGAYFTPDLVAAAKRVFAVDFDTFAKWGFHYPDPSSTATS